ncbi:phage major tail protein, TP901-1 family [Litorimonas haliclonae]|uniref:phage major tail protein, TP901-1 family n=1 Tax=Litorimonas haliclonae TaxID=2081977 RepID=UPI0039EF2AE5
MSAQRGRDMLVKIKQNDESYVTLAGLRTKALRLNARVVDVTDSDSAQGWKELLPNAGVKSAEVSGQGIFRNEASAAQVRQAFFDQDALDLRFLLPGFGQIDGAFLISNLSYSGNYQGEAGFNIILMSAGAPVFNAL